MDWLLEDNDSDSDDCTTILDEWIRAIRDSIYTKIINHPTNPATVLSDYEHALNDFGKKLIHAIEKEEYTVLRELSWPEELMKCIERVNTKIEILDRIRHWCFHFVFTMGIKHIKELQRENAGLTIE